MIRRSLHIDKIHQKRKVYLDLIVNPISSRWWRFWWDLSDFFSWFWSSGHPLGSVWADLEKDSGIDVTRTGPTRKEPAWSPVSPAKRDVSWFLYSVTWTTQQNCFYVTCGQERPRSARKQDQWIGRIYRPVQLSFACWLEIRADDTLKYLFPYFSRK